MKRLTNIIISTILILLSSVFFVSCNNNDKTEFNNDDYILNYEIGSGDFKILQLADVQIGDSDDFDETKTFLDELILSVNPNFLVLTGDNAVYGESTYQKQYKLYEDFYALINSYNIPWSFTFGNHDDEGFLSKSEILEIALKQSKCVMKYGPDNIQGLGNCVINLTRLGEICYSMFLIDSNTYRRYGFFFNGYDFIYPNQIKWYEHAVKQISELKYGKYDADNGFVVPSLAFFHIPLMEFDYAYSEYKKGNLEGSGNNNEGVCSAKINTNMFDSMVNYGSTKGVFVGHDHINYSAVLYKNILLSYGVKSSRNSYYNENCLGGTTITINTENQMQYDRVFINQ